MKKMKTTGTFLCILLLLLQKSLGQLKVFNDEKTLHLPDSYNIGWMQTLNDDKLLSDITIPGTHDTMALHGGPLAECQAWSLMDQLKAGIRFLDLRVSGHNLRIMHGITYQYTSFPEVQKTIEEFLSSYPTEIVLVSVNPALFFETKVPDLVKNKINYSISWVNSSMPTIGEVRGNIVYVQNDNFRLGVPLSETDEDGDYKVTDVEQKEEKIKNHMNHARETYRNGFVVLNYSSGTGVGTWMGILRGLTPKRVAEEINPFLYNYLDENSDPQEPKPCFGIIAMDFPGTDLIQKIIDLN